MFESGPQKRFRDLLIKHEGMRFRPYKCTAGKTSIGVGRNLDDVGITHFEAMVMLSADIERVTKESVAAFPWFQSINVTRQDVILSMAFNMGLPRLMTFKKMLQAVSCQDYVRAAQEMRESKWRGQVGRRADELATMMETGIYAAV